MRSLVKMEKASRRLSSAMKSATSVCFGHGLQRPCPAPVQFDPSRCRPFCQSSSSGAQVSPHNQLQIDMFSKPSLVNVLTDKAQDPVIAQRLEAIAVAIPNLSESSRVVDVGSGTGCMIPHLQARGVQDILAVDLSAPMLAKLREIHAPEIGHLGNQLGVRTWQGDVADLPNYLGWASDAFIFNSVFGNLQSPRLALLKAALQLKPGGYVVISHPMGKAWHTALAAEQPHITVHTLPDEAKWDDLLQGLPLQLVELRDEPELYLAVLQVPHRYLFPGAPIRLEAPVVKGFGRGSRQLGTPTANLDPEMLQDKLPGLQRGVYFGWAQLVPKEDGWREEDLQIHKMVMNVGRRPTVNTGNEDPTVEVHVMHEYAQDFYGQEVRAVALGYIRPELKFSGGLPELLSRIKLDIAVARNQLDDELCAQFKNLL